MQIAPFWEMLLVGIVVVLVLLWMRPGMRAAFQQRRSVSREEWMSLLFPIGLVVLFVGFLLLMVSS